MHKSTTKQLQPRGTFLYDRLDSQITTGTWDGNSIDESGPVEHTEDLADDAVMSPWMPSSTHGMPEQENGATKTSFHAEDEGSQRTPTERLPPVGSFVGQYQLIRLLGRGGMGAVFLARDTRLGRLIALKFIGDQRPALTQRLIDEARATARCNHENIVIVHDVGMHEGYPFMALEYLKGQTLRAWLREQARVAGRQEEDARTPVPVRRVIEIMIPVVRALAYAHGMGIIHRDLKPDNIMITESGMVKVLDFGIAKVLHRPRAMTQTESNVFAPALHKTNTGLVIGTLPYMSPEQMTGQEIDHRSDIWTCGIIMFEMVAGRHPLVPLTRQRLLDAANQLDVPMPSVSEHAGNLGKLAAIIDRCLIKRRENRTPSASDLLAELEAVLPNRQHTLQSGDDNPFAGLAAFQENNADRFFGRSHEVTAAVARLRSHPLVAIVGPSGAGKSSLVRAGIIPALKRSGEGWDAFIIRPGRHPLSALAGLLEQTESMQSTSDQHSVGPPTADGGLDRQALIARMRSEPGYLATVLRSRAVRRLRRMVIFVDQFEELYTLCAEPEERDTFLGLLEAVADDASSPLRVLLSMRSDFLDHLASKRSFAASETQGLVFLPPIGREGLREALTRPVEAMDYRFESPAMVESMLRELDSTPGALPLLQFTAAKLWEQRDRRRRVLLLESYEQLGGVAGALASHADAVLAGMPPADQVLARTVLERLVTPERTRAMVSMSELRALSPDLEAIERVVDHLVSARLLVVEIVDDGVTVELVHESLITNWPMLARWLSEHQEDAAFLAQLRTAAKQWEASGYAEGLLWRGEPVHEAQRWYSRYRGELTPLERRYLGATFALDSRAVRRKRAIIAGSIVCLSLLVLAASVALVWIRRAELEATRQAEIVQRQLDELQRKESQLRTSTEQAKAATYEAEMSREQLHEALAKERAAKEEAEQALAEAQKARDIAREAEKAAREALARAEQASEAEREAKNNLRRFVSLGPQMTHRGVRFNYKPKGRVREMFLAGSFNGWNPSPDYMLKDDDGDGVYSVTVPLRKGTYQYKFLVDGEWVKDPNAPISALDGYGGLNGVFEVD